MEKTDVPTAKGEELDINGNGGIELLFRNPHVISSGAKVPGFVGGCILAFEDWGELYDIFEPDNALLIEKREDAPTISPGIPIHGGKRGSDNVRYLSRVAFLDLDDVEQGVVDRIQQSLSEKNISHLVATTYHHGLPGKGVRVRIVILMDRPVPATEWSMHIGALMRVVTQKQADKSCVDASRVYFAPCYHADRKDSYWCKGLRDGGVPLRWEDVLRDGGVPPASTAVAVTPVLSQRVAVTSAPSVVNEVDVPVPALRTSLLTAQIMPAKEPLNAANLRHFATDEDGLNDDQRKTLLAASNGQRMVIAAGESRPEVQSSGLRDGQIDVFLASLMFVVANRFPTASGAEVQLVFAKSLGILQTDDAAAGNPVYPDDALVKKFLSAKAKIGDTSFYSSSPKRRLSTPHIFLGGEEEHVHVVAMTKSGMEKKPVANFGIKVNRKICLQNQGPEPEQVVYDLTLFGETDTALLSLKISDIITRRSFQLALPAGMVWRGTDAQVVELREVLERYIRANSVPSYRATHRLGISEHEGRPCLVAPYGTFRWDDALWVAPVVSAGAPLFYANNSNGGVRKLVEALAEVESPSLEVIREYTTAITGINEPAVAHPLVGWAALTPLSEALSRLGWRFPILNIVGVQGSGKSTSADAIRLGFPGVTFSVTNMPSYSFAEMIGGSTSFIAIADEFRDTTGTAQGRARIQGQRDVLRANYDRNAYHRTGMASVTLGAPVMVIGEQAVAGVDSATAERTLVVQPRKATLRLDDPSFVAYSKAKEKLDRLAPLMSHSGFWQLFQSRTAVRFGVPMMLKSWLDHWEARVTIYLTGLRLKVELRVRRNLALAATGLSVWNEWRVGLGLSELPFELADICRDTLDELGLTGATRKDADAIATFVGELSAFLVIANKAHKPHPAFWQKDGDELFIHVGGAVRFFHNAGGDRALISNTKQCWRLVEASELGARVESKIKRRINGSGFNSPLTCMVLSIEKLRAAGVDLPEVIGASSGSILA